MRSSAAVGAPSRLSISATAPACAIQCAPLCQKPRTPVGGVANTASGSMLGKRSVTLAK